MNIFQITLLFIFMNIKLFSQSTDKLLFKSFSFGTGICVSDLNSGGINLGVDLTSIYNKNLFSISAQIGGEFNLNIFGGNQKQRDYKELNFFIGRELKLFKGISFEPNIGLGIFNQLVSNGSTNFDQISNTTISIPLRMKLLFYSSKGFAFGLNPNLNMNSLDNTITFNLLLHFNLK